VSQRFWNIAGIIMYGVMLPLSCLFIVLGEPIPFALFAIRITFHLLNSRLWSSFAEKMRSDNAPIIAEGRCVTCPSRYKTGSVFGSSW